MFHHIPLISSILGGGLYLGIMKDRINVLCEENKTIKNDHKLLQEKLLDIHVKVCNIENKLNFFIEK